jgi:hypothetical protein
MWNETPDHSDTFYEAAREISAFLECELIDLLGAANAESGVSAKAMNPRSSATGLIQWMADKHGLYYGLTREAFASLPADVQVRYITRYMRPHRGKLHSAAAIYTAIFLPAFVDRAKDLDYVLCARKGHPEERLGWAYAANAIFDANGDGKITVRELLEAIKRNWDGPRCAEMYVRARIRGWAEWLTPGSLFDLGTIRGIQRRLAELGYDLGPAGADGVLGEYSYRALLTFQTTHGLVADAIPGPRTRAALEAA